MSTTQLFDLAWQGFETGRFDPSPQVGKYSYEDGERAQLEVLNRRLADGDTRVGWKVGLTSGNVRDSFGAGIRPFGYLLRSRLFASGAEVPLAGIGRAGLETELSFRFGRRVSGEVTPDEIRAALAGVAPAFEINQDRIDGDPDPAVKAADNLTQWAIVRGPEVTPVPDPFDWDGLVSTLSRDGVVLETVKASGHIDDHLLSLSRLARELGKFGLAIEEGDVVITGSFTRQRGLAPGHYEGTFAGLGAVTLTLAG
ncbi:MAG TPA: fumarylacetoacetate hydrolase family protein [Streptosporangiaceae bacterium]|jgi:2-keto-4-pentenoate hydratase